MDPSSEPWPAQIHVGKAAGFTPSKQYMKGLKLAYKSRRLSLIGLNSARLRHGRISSHPDGSVSSSRPVKSRTSWYMEHSNSLNIQTQIHQYGHNYRGLYITARHTQLFH